MVYCLHITNFDHMPKPHFCGIDLYINLRNEEIYLICFVSKLYETIDAE